MRHPFITVQTNAKVNAIKSIRACHPYVDGQCLGLREAKDMVEEGFFVPFSKLGFFVQTWAEVEEHFNSTRGSYSQGAMPSLSINISMMEMPSPLQW